MSGQTKSHLSAWIGRVVLIVLLVYPLSMGPVSRLAFGTRCEPLLVIYEPLERLHRTPFDHVMQWYIKVFRAIAG